MSQPLLQTAIDHHRAGRPLDAEPIYRQLLSRSPRDPQLLHLLGTALVQTGRVADAIPLLRAAARIANGAPQVFIALAQAQRLNGNFEDAEKAATRAVALKPAAAVAHNELALALMHQRKSDAAIAAWQRAIQLRPDYAEAHSNLGASLAEKGRLAEAIESLHLAVQFNPNHAPAQNNLANALDELKRTDEAIPHWRTALQLQPDFFDALLNLGKTIHGRGDYAEAASLLERAIALRPADPHARFLRGLLRLMHGDLVRGFADYEHRFHSPHFDLAGRSFPQPQWTGGDVAGKTLLLHAEQGLGDTIQFVRYASLLFARGAIVLLESPPELAELLQSVPGIAQVIARGQPLPAFDLHASVVSLPHLFGTTMATIPAQIRYIWPSPQRSAQCADILGAADGARRVGLVWAGNPKHSNDRRRSIRLRDFAAAVKNVAGITWFSLQKGPAAEQVEEPGLPIEIIDQADDLETFSDTAALIANLDLVITVDTAVAHLAGAMGKPVWMLLAFVPDWRWLLDRPDTPWYPTMRLFRQRRLDDWSNVFQELSQALERA